MAGIRLGVVVPPPWLRVEEVPTEVAPSKFDLGVYVDMADGALVAHWLYKKELFAAAEVEALASGFEALLRNAAEDPGCRLSALVAESEEARCRRVGEDARVHEELVVRFNATAAPYPAARTMADLFEEQARRTPMAPAVRCGETALTFAELDARANRLAGALRVVRRGPRRAGGGLPRTGRRS